MLELQDITVLVCTHNPDRNRLARTLRGLRDQTLPAQCWETILIDNASVPAIDAAVLADSAPEGLRLVRESALGLTSARRRGFMEAKGQICVLVDDDNVLAPDYLAHVVSLFATNPLLGAIGGRIVPEFEKEPAGWQREFLDLLALRDLGDMPKISDELHPAGNPAIAYPECAPPGAGLAIRRAAALQWATGASLHLLPDRRGRTLSSGGDNDIVLTIMKRGWKVAYSPELQLRHIIPAERLERTYLARLNRGIQESWMRVLSKHGANPWPQIPAWTVPLRKIKAWFTYRAWAGPAAHIRWSGACGHFEGRAAGSSSGWKDNSQPVSP